MANTRRGSPLPPGVVAFLKGVVVVAALVAFASMFGVGIYDTWRAAANTPPVFNDPFLYIATTIAALIGGIVAVGLAKTPPLPPPPPPPATKPQGISSSPGAFSEDLAMISALN